MIFALTLSDVIELLIGAVWLVGFIVAIVLGILSRKGMPISPRRHEIAKKLQEQYKPILERLLTVGNINWNSPSQVAKILFTKKDKPVYNEKGEKLPNTYEVIEYSFMNDEILRGEFDTRKEAICTFFT